MLRFFRSIRQKLFLEGRVSKYLGYAVGEIVLIVVGIMIALEANEWKEERRDRAEEIQILSRISEELNLIVSDITWMLELPARRKVALDRISRAFEGQPIDDNISFLDDVANAASWDQPNLIRSTYDEVHIGGKLGLIQNIDLRNEITRFYDQIEAWEKRATLRVTGFAKLAYELVPTVVGGSGTAKRSVRDGLTPQQYADLVNLVFSSDLKRLITPARNRQDFLDIMWVTIQDGSRELLSEIQAELAN